MILSNQLADLAERVKAAAAAIDASQLAAAEHAITAGGLLVEAKASVAHGEWLPFLERAGIGKRQAQRYMALWRSGLKASSVTLLGGVKPALTFLAEWQLPAFDQMLLITDRQHQSDEASPDCASAYVWEDSQHRGCFNVGIFITEGEEERTLFTKSPMKPFVAVEGDRPVNTIVEFLLTHGSNLPIDDWQLTLISREPAISVIVAPCMPGNTNRGAAA